MKRYDLTKYTHRLFVYYRILIELDAEDYRHRTEEFRELVINLRKNLATFRWYVEEAINRKVSKSDPRYMSWRDIPFQVRKIKQCRGCGRPFYDVSRNGRMTFCHWIPYTRYNYTKDEYYPTQRKKDGVPISFCEMRYEAERKRREYHNGASNGKSLSFYSDTTED